MVLFLPVLGWQEAVLELRTGGAVPWERELSHRSFSTWSPWQSSALLGFSFLENLGIFHCFLEACAGISRVTSVSGAGNASQRGWDLFFSGIKGIQCSSKNLPCRVMARSGLFLNLLLLSCVVCPLGMRSKGRAIHPKAGQKALQLLLHHFHQD